jgi:hypothetical protein
MSSTVYWSFDAMLFLHGVSWLVGWLVKVHYYILHVYKIDWQMKSFFWPDLIVIISFNYLSDKLIAVKVLDFIYLSGFFLSPKTVFVSWDPRKCFVVM